MIINISVNDLFEPVIIKCTGVACRLSEVNSISYKTVDSAVYLDSLDAVNYPVRCPYGTKESNLSYESWVKFKIRFNKKYHNCLNGTIIRLPYTDENGVTKMKSYSRLSNIRIGLKFTCFSGFDVKYGFVDEYSTPVKTVSTVATKNIKEIQSPNSSGDYSISMPLGDIDGMLIGDLDDYYSDFFVSQLTVYKGCEQQNVLLRLSLTYDLV